MVITWQLDLINWYNIHKRDLPWRNTKDPFKIWLSEIILQQTRVAQGMPYYYKFIEKFPTVKDLANAEIDSILKLWQGLGYYSRARNLHACAQQIMEKHKGNFPTKHDEIIQLKGIGNYTAAAISSFAFGDVYPVLDGNVFRVLSRMFNIDTPINSNEGIKIFQNLAKEVIYKKDPASYNQAMMELGAMVCKPQNPTCEICVLRIYCEAYKNNRVDKLPIKLNKVKVKERFFNYLIIQNEGKICWTKREANDIWKGLYEFPYIESRKKINSDDLNLALNDFISNKITSQNVLSLDLLYETKHILTHQKIFAQFWKIKFKSKKRLLFKNSSIFEISVTEIDQFGIARITEKFLQINKLE